MKKIKEVFQNIKRNNSRWTKEQKNLLQKYERCMNGKFILNRKEKFIL